MKYKVGGYVSYDTPKKDEYGYPLRKTVEINTEVELGKNTPDDCGAGTNAVVCALEAIVEKRFKVDRNVKCSECWER